MFYIVRELKYYKFNNICNSLIWLTAHDGKNNGSFQKTSIPPPRRKLEVNPPTPFGCPNTLTIIRNNFFSPPDGRNFLCGGSVDLFWNDAIRV
jgi:hypothetical protein